MDEAAKSILVNVRLPRVAAALLAGAALAVAGAIIQAVLDNPLASPNVIGVNSGAGLFVLMAAAFFPQVPWISPCAAFVGALATAAVIFVISLNAGVSRLTVVLSGIAITTVFGAGMNTILIVAPDAYVGSSMFLAGGFSGVLLRDLAWPAALIAVGLAAGFSGAHRLNIIALGDDGACAGLHVRASELGMLAVAALLAGAAVSFAGLLGFVGLIIPHIVRFLAGHDNRAVLPISALLGAAFVVGCDLLTRVLFAPYEVPVGILMAFAGGPFFIYLIFKNRRGGLD
ncbi:MAG: FecCD family ABC transporter permease [Slackia sp.]